MVDGIARRSSTCRIDSECRGRSAKQGYCWARRPPRPRNKLARSWAIAVLTIEIATRPPSGDGCRSRSGSALSSGAMVALIRAAAVLVRKRRSQAASLSRAAFG